MAMVNSVATEEKKEEITIETENEWILVFRQTFSLKSNVYNTAWQRDVLRLNENDPSAANYAILHKLEKFRNPQDNKFEFKLFWPNHPQKKYQHWKQKINPIDRNSTGNVNNGYEAIEIHHTYADWGGLEWTAAHSANGNTCLMNGTPSSDYYYWYAVGIYDKGYQGAISGPDGTTVDKVELWLKTPVVSNKSVVILKQRIDELEQQNAALKRKCRAMNIDESKYLEWSCDDVCDWIVSLDEKYQMFGRVLRANFKKNDIDGSALDSLANDEEFHGEMRRYGIESYKHRTAIRDHMKQLSANKQAYGDEGNSSHL